MRLRRHAALLLYYAVHASVGRNASTSVTARRTCCRKSGIKEAMKKYGWPWMVDGASAAFVVPRRLVLPRTLLGRASC